MRKILKFIPITLLTVALVWIVALRAQIAQSEPWAMAPPEVDMGGIVERDLDAAEVTEDGATVLESRIVEAVTDSHQTEVVRVAYNFKAAEEEPAPTPVPTPAPTTTEEPELAPSGADEHTDEVWILATVFAGECYPDDYEDMLKVGMCCYNRVDNEAAYFPDTLIGVVTQPNQVFGYYSGNVPYGLYIEAAKEVVDRYYAIKSGLAMPWDSEILYWCAGGDGHNHFRSTY